MVQVQNSCCEEGEREQRSTASNVKSLARVRKHSHNVMACICVIFSSKPGGPRAGKKAHSCIMGWNGMLPETWQKDKGMKQTRVLARDQLQWGPWNVGQE